MAEAYDEYLCRRMNKRYRELAGMFKEIGKGTLEILEKVVCRFAMQEGLRDKTAERYLNTFIKSGLIIVKEGSCNWYYNQDAEWDLFKINI